MANAIEPLRPADLPDRERSIWKLTGPGAIMVGIAVGSGELVLWPWVVARFGASMTWAPLLALFFQVCFVLEIGRWAVATGESALRAHARVAMQFIYLFILLSFVLTALQGWSRGAAATLRTLFIDLLAVFGMERPWGDESVFQRDWLWAIPVTLALWLVLLGPKKIYNGVEKVVMVLVMVILGGVVLVAFKLGTADHVGQMAKGMFTFPPKIAHAEDFSFLRLYGASVFAGAGGFGLLFYAHYLRDKGFGMGKRFPMLTIDIRGKEERANETGYIFSDTPDNRKRFRDWFNFVRFDSIVIFGVVSAVSLLLCMFAAFAALYPKDLGFGDHELVASLSGILGHPDALGKFGSYLFMVITMAALFSTMIGNHDGGIRNWIDMFHTGIPSTRKWSAGALYVPILLGGWVVGIVVWVILEYNEVSILDFFFINATISGLVMALFAPVVLYLNLKYLPKFARPGPVSIFFVLVGTFMYGAGGLYAIWDKIREVLERAG